MTQTTDKQPQSADTHSKPAIPGKQKRLPWHPLVAVIVVLAIYFGSSIIGQILITIYPYLKHLTESQVKDYLTSTTAQFLYIVIVEGLTLGALYLFLKAHKVSFKTLGLIRPRLVDIGYALLAIMPYIVLYSIILVTATHLFPHIDVNQEQQLGFGSQEAGIALAMTFISLVVLPPLVEEILVRGFLFNSLRGGLKLWPAIIVTSVIFGAAHLQFGSGEPLLWVAAIDTFALSIILCYLRYKTGSLWPGIALHALKNLVAFVSLFIFHIT
jgi:membrane protease YdiL (CAAX protease family)